jgi:hypothetical protein
VATRLSSFWPAFAPPPVHLPRPDKGAGKHHNIFFAKKLLNSNVSFFSTALFYRVFFSARGIQKRYTNPCRSIVSKSFLGKKPKINFCVTVWNHFF